MQVACHIICRSGNLVSRGSLHLVTWRAISARPYSAATRTAAPTSTCATATAVACSARASSSWALQNVLADRCCFERCSARHRLPFDSMHEGTRGVANISCDVIRCHSTSDRRLNERWVYAAGNRLLNVARHVIGCQLTQ
jgi:hypothetical protein